MPGDSAARKAPLTDPSSLRIATFSRLDRWKGLDTLLAAAGLLQAENLGRSITVDIFGGSHDADVGYAEELRERAAMSPVPVTLHGHIPDVAKHMREVDIVVVPSLHPEPFGQVVAQALSHGCVTIVSNQGGAIEQVRHGYNGLTFEPGDPRSLAHALAQAVRTPGLSAALTAHAREYGESMSDRVLASAFDAAVVELTTELAHA
jgi:glycosyltransferase involved in cell wall biosynthesis